ncbi:hypothetical protein FP026_04735 [Rhizobium tropici]|uniref:Uncharacterized protein n=1 Tax=Rhizobium tropici TaxID=398 RepID=A0A5B0WCP4_RHITR|nr:hypothetical protein [Rhizobium tropici]KAA1184683.1 hypothetical protein FP026_04735 [Rhizobium tropici]
MSSSSYQIVVRNLSQTAQYFYVFQKRAVFEPSAGTIYCSSLGCQYVSNYDNSGAQIIFGLDRQIYAGAISTAVSPPPPPLPTASNASGTLRLLVSKATAKKAISLTTDTGNNPPTNFTELTLSPLGFSPPTYQSGISVGAFGVKVPPYTPAPYPELFCGVAALYTGESVVLSSFVAPVPNAVMSCAPAQVFFVKTGYQPIASLLAYDESNSARCDFTAGFATITATYNSNGTFSTTGGP